MNTKLLGNVVGAWLIALGPSCIDIGAIARSTSGVDAATTCQPCLKAPGCSDTSRDSANLVSGLESGCAVIDQRDGRNGGWFTYLKAGQSQINPPATDDFADFPPSCEAANGSCYSACVNGTISGSGYQFAGFGLVFHPNAIMYDLSRWQGVSFYVRGNVGLSSLLRFVVPLAADSVVGIGSGTCTNGCSDPYQIPIPGFGPGASHDWQQARITFASLRQQGFGKPEPWRPETAISLQWEVTAVQESVENDPFQICVDQVELIP